MFLKASRRHCDSATSNFCHKRVVQVDCHFRTSRLDEARTLSLATIPQQRELAERGLKNDLAFEEKKERELEKQRLLNAQKQKKEHETVITADKVDVYV